MIAGAGETGGDEHRPDFVAVQTRGVRLVIQPRPADVDSRGVIEQSFFDG